MTCVACLAATKTTHRGSEKFTMERMLFSEKKPKLDLLTQEAGHWLASLYRHAKKKQKHLEVILPVRCDRGWQTRCLYAKPSVKT
jgi:hypothetical protein